MSPTASPPRRRRFRWVRAIFKLMGAFVVLSLLLVLIYRFVPPPVTLTMLMDPNGITKDWTSLDEIDPNMARAAIAGEDSRFCSHHGFDAVAIAQALRHNASGGRIRGGSTVVSALHPRPCVASAITTCPQVQSSALEHGLHP